MMQHEQAKFLLNSKKKKKKNDSMKPLYPKTDPFCLNTPQYP